MCNRTHNINNTAHFHMTYKSIKEPFVGKKLHKDSVFGIMYINSMYLPILSDHMAHRR